MEYKRLTERVGRGVCVKETSSNDNKSIWNAIERLAELEDKIERGELVDVKENHLIAISRGNGKSYKQLETIEILTKYENGTLIELPCKVGDTVYCIYHNGECDYWIEEELVHDFILTNDGEIDIGTECRMIGKFYRYGVFLTKSEAEAKLKELKNEY
jgi:hypothetical protein